MRLILLCLIATASAQDFSTQIQPILARNCLGCHNERLRTSGLSLESKESIRLGGKRGPVGERLIDAVRQTGELKMPPGKKLAPHELALLEKWAGAGFPGLGAQSTAHWAFVKPRRDAGTIDNFIHQRG